MPFSAKQQEYLRNATRRWNIKTGATRSGKTFLDFSFVIPKRILNCFGNGLIVLMGNTLGTINRNVLEPMRGIWGGDLVGEIRQNDNSVALFGKKVYVLGADKKNRVAGIQGSGMEYCYGDEITTWSEDVFQMLKSRLDKPNSVFDGTCNPDNPMHWFKSFLDSDADVYHQHYTIDDNPFLDDAFKDNLKREYAGTVFYDRFILGKWVRAEGLIYPMFDENLHVVDASGYTYDRYIISIDYGTMNPFSAGLWGRSDGTWVRIREFYYDGRKTNKQLTDEEYHTKLIEFADGLPIDMVIIDPSAASFVACMRKHGVFRHRPAYNAVIEGIRNTATAMKTGKIMIDASCTALIGELQGYSWDEKVQEDRPIKENDHACDDMRYFVNTIVMRAPTFSFE